MKRVLIALVTAAVMLGSLQNTAIADRSGIVIEAQASEGSAYESEVRKIFSGMNKGWTREEKLLYLHDYLVTHTEYDRTYSRYSAYDAIVGHKAVCQGYAEAYADLAKRAGIECQVITSRANNHAWNAVNLSNKWYYVDCTFDDPIGPSDPMFCKHNNFLRNEAGMRDNGHIGHDWVIGHWGSNVNGKYTSKTYENAHWRNAPNRPFTFLTKGVAYYVQSEKAIYSYNCNRGKVKKLVKDDMLSSSATLANVGDEIYVNGEYELFCLKKNAGKLALVHELSDAERMSGVIAGLEITGKELRYDIGSADFAYFDKATVNMSGYLDTTKAKEIVQSSIELDKDLIKLTDAATSEKIKATTKGIKSVTWTTDNKAVATVSNGTVTAVGNGTCRITAKGNGVSASCIVRVQLLEPEPEPEPEETDEDAGQDDVTGDDGGQDLDNTDNPAGSDNTDGTIPKEEPKEEVIPDTTWQQDFREHYIMNGRLVVYNYKGGAKDLVVPARAVVKGKEYEVSISGTLVDGSLSGVSDTVETISFEKGVKIENCYNVAKNCKKLRSIDLQGCDASSVAYAFNFASQCPKLEKVSLKGLDLSSWYAFSMFSDCPKLSVIVAPRYFNPSGTGNLGGEWRTKGKNGWSTEGFSYLRDVPANTTIYKYSVTVKKNTKFAKGGITYKITDASSHRVSAVKITGKKAVIPDSVVYNGTRYLVTGIGAKAAQNNKALKSLSIGAGVTSIGNSAFDGCTGLKTIKVTSGVISKMGKNAFGKVSAKLVTPADRRTYYNVLWKNAGYKG